MYTVGRSRGLLVQVLAGGSGRTWVPMVWSTMRVGEWRDHCGDQRPEAGQGAEMVNHSAGKPANGTPGAAWPASPGTSIGLDLFMTST